MNSKIPLIDTEVPLTPIGSWKQKTYLLDKRSAYALQMALSANRPLLVKGEPGLGKSYLALAAAKLLDRAFIAEIINSHSQGQDLLWKDDPIQRLNDAQSKLKKEQELHPKRYINPGVLWWTFDWESAEQQYDQLHHKIYKPQDIKAEKLKNGIVLLIDEIDKADPSLPNSLLEVLGNNGFNVGIAKTTVGQTGKQPLVIVTTNNERELPPAFVRRCLVLNLKVDEGKLEQWLIKRVRTHFTEKQCGNIILEEAVQQLKEDRASADRQGIIKPGLSEYIDLIAALVKMTENEKDKDKAQHKLLGNIAEFSLQKADI